jgi:hypothetical protein
MALPEPSEVVRPDIGDAPFVYFAGRDQPSGNQAAQPRGGGRIELVVVNRLRH